LERRQRGEDIGEETEGKGHWRGDIGEETLERRQRGEDRERTEGRT
jgi:hypothetical protein